MHNRRKYLFSSHLKKKRDSPRQGVAQSRPFPTLPAKIEIQ